MTDPRSWIGAAVAGEQGEPLGHVGAVYYDNATGMPAWAAVQARTHAAVVPLARARFDGATLHLPYTAEQLQSAPHHDPTTLISYQEGDDLARHYGVLPPAPPRLDPPRLTADDVIMTRSEEQIQVATVNVVIGKARLVTSIVTENQTFIVPVRRQVVSLVYEPIPAHEQTIAPAPPQCQDHEIVLHEEQVLITTQIVPVERVRMVKQVRAHTHTITEPLRTEHIDAEHTTTP